MIRATEANVQVRGPENNFHTSQHGEEEHIKHISALQSASTELTLCNSLASHQELDLISPLGYKLVQHTDGGLQSSAQAQLAAPHHVLQPGLLSPSANYANFLKRKLQMHGV